VLERAKVDLGRFYPTVDGKPTVAYLWARTVPCKNCRLSIPLLKTRWLCKKDNKRVLLTMEPNADRTGVVFGIQLAVPVASGNPAQRREHDRRLGQGTMSRNGAWCPSCGKPGTVAMGMADIRQEGMAGRLSAVMTAVVVDGERGKEYRLPVPSEIETAANAEKEIERVFSEIPFGLPTEPLPRKEALGFRVPLYGIDQWHKLFTPRQLLALGVFAKHTRGARGALAGAGYIDEWSEAVAAYLGVMLDRLANQGSTVAHWNIGGEKIEGIFARFALPIVWDFAEVNPLGDTSGGYPSAFGWVTLVARHFTGAVGGAPAARVAKASAISLAPEKYDVIVTDPPYYDAIPYSDLMDFFYVWLRRTLGDLSIDDEAGVRGGARAEMGFRARGRRADRRREPSRWRSRQVQGRVRAGDVPGLRAVPPGAR
jgi:adenine-specific DNA methylase